MSDNEFIPLEEMEIRKNLLKSPVKVVKPENINLNKLHKSLGINFELQENENEVIDDDVIIINPEIPEIVVLDDDEEDEENDVEDCGSEGNFLNNNNDDDDYHVDDVDSVIARNFQKFLESSDYDYLNSDEFSNIEPEVILAENDSQTELIFHHDDPEEEDDYEEEEEEEEGHSENVYPKKPYKCGLCGREVVSRYNLKRHMMIHTGEKPHECEICHKRFREYSDVRKHKKIHLIKEYNCNICFRNLPHPDNPTQCFFCVIEHKVTLLQYDNKIMNNPSIIPPTIIKPINLKKQSNHSDDGDDEKDEKIITTTDKMTTLSDDNNLLLDRNFMHAEQKQLSVRKISNNRRKRRTYICHICNKTFGSGHNLKRHHMIHTGEKPFKCSECDKQFREFNCLRKHLLFHSGEKPYKCDICGKPFTDLGNLNKHKYVHSDQYHECSVCGKKFNYSSNLFKHFRLHTGEKPFSCIVCEKTFRSKHHMQSHVLIHYKS